VVVNSEPTISKQIPTGVGNGGIASDGKINTLQSVTSSEPPKENIVPMGAESASGVVTPKAEASPSTPDKPTVPSTEPRGSKEPKKPKTTPPRLEEVFCEGSSFAVEYKRSMSRPFASQLRKLVLLSDKGTSLAVVTRTSIAPLMYTWGITLAHWAFQRNVSGELRASILCFAFQCRSYVERYGIKQFITGMKFSFYAVNAFLSGNPVLSSRDYGANIKMVKGLPALLPIMARRRIRSLDP
jgi:hypothetical protein